MTLALQIEASSTVSLPEILKAIKEKIGITEEGDTLVPNDIKHEISADVGNEWDELVFWMIWNLKVGRNFENSKKPLMPKDLNSFKNIMRS